MISGLEARVEDKTFYLADDIAVASYIGFLQQGGSSIHDRWKYITIDAFQQDISGFEAQKFFQMLPMLVPVRKFRKLVVVDASKRIVDDEDIPDEVKIEDLPDY